ncbi:fibrinogen silencer-binding protein-like [Lytechinus pictus]|uniref:fibrinogen silencer-binding protein-like n=1 Tax=Lytechinus pictus TaxID=7653 RepID=UPI0030B9CDD6
MPKANRFTLEERMDVLELIKPKVAIVDALTSDFVANEKKKEVWEEITRDFIKDRPDRQELTSKEVRELWRRVKHRARMDVRHAIQNAKVGHVRSMGEADNLGWLPEDNTGHKVIDINDLGLEVDTKFITDFVPLLEEEATVLETRNGVLLDYNGKGSTKEKRRASSSHSVPSNGKHKVAKTDSIGGNDVYEVIEVEDRTSPEVETPLSDLSSPNQENQGDTSQIDSMYDVHGGIQIAAVMSQQPEFAPDTTSRSASHHFDQHQRVRTSTTTGMNPSLKPAMNSKLGMYIGMNSMAHPSIGSPMSSDINTNMASDMGMSSGTTRASTAMKDTDKELTALSIEYLKQEHEAKMELIRLKQSAAKAKSETARAKRSAYDEKRMFYFEKRKQLHEDPV